MRKHIVLVALISFMLVFSLQIAQPVAAAKLKLIDKGSYTIKDPYFGTYTYSWKTYQKGTKYVKIKSYMKPKGQKTQTMTITLRTFSRHILQTRYHMNGRWISTTYTPEKLSAAQYYWRVIRPEIRSPPL